jgi:uncharacterized protein YggE
MASILLVIISASAEAQITVSAPSPNISVSGTAEIRVAPDEVNLRLGVESRDLKLDEARQQNERAMTTILAFLKDSAIEPSDVQTDYVEIQPVYDPEAKAKQVVPNFFLVRRNLGVRLRNVAQFDAVLAGVLNSGATHIMGIEFRTTELRKHRDAARQQAIRAAKEKAVALAEELDAKIGKPQSIQEQTAGGWWSWSCANANISNAMFQESRPGDTPDGTLAVGLISISATVTVTFSLE